MLLGMSVLRLLYRPNFGNDDCELSLASTLPVRVRDRDRVRVSVRFGLGLGLGLGDPNPLTS